MGSVVNVLNLFDSPGAHCRKNARTGTFGLGVDGDLLGRKKIHNSRIKEKIRASCNMNVLTSFVIIISVLIRMRTPSNWSKRKLFTNLKSNKTAIISKLILLKPRILYTSKYMYLIDSCLLDLVKCKT